MLMMTMMRCLIVVLLLLASTRELSIAQPSAALAANSCGEVITIDTHNRTTMRYTPAQDALAQDARLALVLLAGGSGNINLDDKGCPRFAICVPNWRMR